MLVPLKPLWYFSGMNSAISMVLFLAWQTLAPPPHTVQKLFALPRPLTTLGHPMRVCVCVYVRACVRACVHSTCAQGPHSGYNGMDPMKKRINTDGNQLRGHDLTHARLHPAHICRHPSFIVQLPHHLHN